ncbi:MAG: electron transport complex subunit RsxC [Thermodesulfobacteriota bacterium]
MKFKTFENGIHPDDHKELTEKKTVERAALPGSVIIPLQQHAGPTCEPLVKRGDVVEEGQKIGDVKAFIGAPVHSSINGKVKEIDSYLHPVGMKVLSVVIESDGTSKEWPRVEGIDLAALTPEEIRGRTRDAGIVGMGGAAFPTSVKLSVPKGKKIDTVLLNGCECEPYLTADHRIMVEAPEKVIWGLRALMKTSGAEKGLIGIEANKPDAVEVMKGAISGSPEIDVIVLETKYPQGAEKMLIKAALGRKVPLGKLPLDVGVVVNNVGTAAAVYDAFHYSKPLFERVVTVSGNGIDEPKNLLVRVGTTFEDVINQCGGLKGGAGEFEVLNGGPMMGIAQSSLNVPVIKGTSGITVLAEDKIKAVPLEPCIRCSGCVEVCPMGLMPYRLGDYGITDRTPDFKGWGGMACIECGCCSFVCPSRRPLLQWIRVGKLRVRQESQPVSA